jgi:hypothetical protein
MVAICWLRWGRKFGGLGLALLGLSLVPVFLWTYQRPLDQVQPSEKRASQFSPSPAIRLAILLNPVTIATTVKTRVSLGRFSKEDYCLER